MYNLNHRETQTTTEIKTMFKAISHYQATQAIKKSIGEKAFKKLHSQWQKEAAKGKSKLSFAQWYKAKRSAQVDKLVNSWMTKAA